MNSPNRSSNTSVKERGEIEAGCRPAPAHAVLEGGMAEAVIGGALLIVLQDVIGFVDFLEFDFGGVVAGIAVGMKFHRQLAIGRLELVDRRALLAAQDFVITALAHGRLSNYEIRPPDLKRGTSHASSRHPRSGSGLGRALLLVVVDFRELGVDDIVVGLGLARAVGGGVAAAASACCALYMASPSFIEAWARVWVLAWMSSTSSLLTASFSAAIAFSMAVRSAGVDLVAMLGQRLLGRMDQRIALVLGFDQLAALLVFGGMGFGFLDHLLDVGVRQTARGLDADLLLLAGGLVLGGDADDAVGVDVEGDFDLRHAARRRRNAHAGRTGRAILLSAAISRSPWKTRMVTAV